MGESLLAFAWAVAGYWWAIVGLLASFLFDVPAMLGSEAFQRRWDQNRTRLKHYARWGAVLAIFVATFLVYHDERAARIKAESEQEFVEQWPTILQSRIHSEAYYLSNFSDKVTSIDIFVSNSSSDKFRISLFDMFELAHWPKPRIFSQYRERGIMIVAREETPHILSLVNMLIDTNIYVEFKQDPKFSADVIYLYFGDVPH